MGNGCPAPSRFNSTLIALGMARRNVTVPSDATCGVRVGAGTRGTGAAERAGGAAAWAAMVRGPTETKSAATAAATRYVRWHEPVSCDSMFERPQSTEVGFLFLTGIKSATN